MSKFRWKDISGGGFGGSYECYSKRGLVATAAGSGGCHYVKAYMIAGGDAYGELEIFNGQIFVSEIDKMKSAVEFFLENRSWPQSVNASPQLRPAPWTAEDHQGDATSQFFEDFEF